MAAQVLAGPANASPGAVACGRPFGLNVVVYGSGGSVVVALAGAELLVLQELAVGVDTVESVAWSPDGCRFAACGYGRVVIFEAAPAEEPALCPYSWRATTVLQPPEQVAAVAWVARQPTDMLLCAGTEIGLWHTSPPAPAAAAGSDDEALELSQEEEDDRKRTLEVFSRRLQSCYMPDDTWRSWRTDPPVPACFAASSRDGEVFATCGRFENQAQVWLRGASDGDYACHNLPHPQRILNLSWSGAPTLFPLPRAVRMAHVPNRGVGDCGAPRRQRSRCAAGGLRGRHAACVAVLAQGCRLGDHVFRSSDLAPGRPRLCRR